MSYHNENLSPSDFHHLYLPIHSFSTAIPFFNFSTLATKGTITRSGCGIIIIRISHNLDTHVVKTITIININDTTISACAGIVSLAMNQWHVMAIHSSNYFRRACRQRARESDLILLFSSHP